VVGLGEPALHQPLGPAAVAATAAGQVERVIVVAGRRRPVQFAGEPGLGGGAGQGDHRLPFDPVLRRPEHALAEGAHPEELPVGPDRHPGDRAAEGQCGDGVAGLVVGGDRA
jgi:hypothetical protein